MPEWVQTLLARDSFTAKDAGLLAGCYGQDAITKLRARRDVTVGVVGDDGSSYKRKIYRLRKRSAVTPQAEQAAAWQAVFNLCVSLGMEGEQGESGIECVKRFISGLARQCEVMRKL